MQTHITIGKIILSLLPVLFVLLLGYWAGKHHRFTKDQASGFSTLALNFALPAALFVSMTHLKRDQLIQQWSVVVSLLISYVLVYAIVFFIARRVKSLGTQGAAIMAILVSFPAAPVYGLAILNPLFGEVGSETVNFVALAGNLILMPVTLALLSSVSGEGSSTGGKQAPQTKKSGHVFVQTIKSPLVWAPLSGVILVLLNVKVPPAVDTTLQLLGVASSGVAIFASGLVLAAHNLTFSGQLWLTAFARVIAAPAVLFLFLYLFGVKETSGAVALVATALPTAVIGVLLATKHRVAESVTATNLFVTTVAIIAVLPLWAWIATFLH